VSLDTITHFRTHMLTMNKADIINKVHDTLGGTKADAERAVETMIDSIVDSLKDGNEVSIAGLGIFSAKMRNARTARNPRTGEPIEVPAMRVPKFRAAKALKDAVK
jgi:DNA-binding protein HU-beta